MSERIAETAGGASAGTPAVHFLTLGCPKNEVDTDRMKAAVMTAGYLIADEPDEAGVFVVNTCSFIQDATEESIELILEAGLSWLPARAGRRLIVAGCMPSRYGPDLAEAMPEVDAFVPVAEENALVDVLERLVGAPPEGTQLAAGARRAVSPSGASCTPSRTASGPSAYLQVSDGCHRRCSYCTIPAIRGPYASRPLEEIVDEARFLVSTGAKEIVLIGQDISSYGRDFEARGSDGEATNAFGMPDTPTLADVVREVARVEGLAWLRLMYVQPDGITQELLDVMASEAAVCRYLDMPLQHASAEVLRRMHRKGSGAEFLRLIKHIRDVMPDIVLRTSLIAGFPGEHADDVRQLERFLEAARIDYAGVFSYSPEDGTPAASMPDLPPKHTRLHRTQQIRDVADRVGFEKAASRVGCMMEVLVEGRDEEKNLVGRWCGQAPEVDGLVLISSGPGEPPPTVGEIVTARVVDSLGYDLEAEVM